MGKNRWIWLALIIILMTLTLTACSSVTPVPAGSTPQSSAAPVTLTIWHQWSGEYLTALQAVFYQYMTDHQNVTIVLEAPQDVQTSLQQSISNGSGPDILSWGNDAIGTYANKGYIVDLDSLGITQDYLKTNYEPAAASGVVWQGKIWAVPENQDAIAIVYNKALVSSSDFPSDPLDFAGLLDKAKSYAEAHPGKYLLCNQGLGAADTYHEAPIYFGFGVPGFVDEAGHVYIDSPQAIAAGKWIKEFSPYGPKDTSQDICSTGFTNGTFAAWWTNPEAIASIQNAGIDFGVLPMGKPFVGIQAMMITNNAAKRGTAAIALDLIKYFTNTANQIQLSLANKTIPANSAALNDAQVQALPVIKGFGAAANIGIPVPSTPFAEPQWAIVGNATLAIWNGSKTPEQALSAAQKAMQTAIASMK